jgi:Uncharacterised protein family (UPF0149)
MNAPGLEALSASEVEQLAERLVGIKNEDALSLEEVDGLVCALIAGPESVLPSEYLPMIFGGDPGNRQTFADIENDRLFRPWVLCCEVRKNGRHRHRPPKGRTLRRTVSITLTAGPNDSPQVSAK